MEYRNKFDPTIFTDLEIKDQKRMSPLPIYGKICKLNAYKLVTNEKEKQNPIFHSNLLKKELAHIHKLV